MLLIYAPYPHAHLSGDGWMRRIGAVDEIFANRERCYIFPAQFGSRTYGNPEPVIERITDSSSFFPVDFRFCGHRRRLLEMIHACDFVYAHTVHSAQFLLPYYCTGKIITDMHGIAPEEELLQGKPQVAEMFGSYEEAAARQSAAIIVVTRAMEAHYRAKYPGLATPFILLPIHNEVQTAGVLERPARERPVVMYAGGSQAWQNLDLMMQAAAAQGAAYDFHFLTRDQDELRAAAGRHGVDGRAHIRYSPPESLAQEYAGADFGFVLRDDIAVNRVACPTKLMEYLAHGLVPVMKLMELGDFQALGGRGLALEDFLAGRIPDAQALNAMRRANLQAFRNSLEAFQQGCDALRALQALPARLNPLENAALFLSTEERTQLYPAPLILEFALADDPQAERRRVVMAQVCGPAMEASAPLPGGRLASLGVRPLPGAMVIAGQGEARFVTADGQVFLRPLLGPAASPWGQARADADNQMFGVDCAGLPDGLVAVDVRLKILAAGAELFGLVAGEAAQRAAERDALLVELAALRQQNQALAEDAQRPAAQALQNGGQAAAGRRLGPDDAWAMGIRGLTQVLARKVWRKIAG